LQADKLTHILYAFANVNLDGTIVLGDPWADTDIKFEKGTPHTLLIFSR
jgi:chitinase